MITNEKILKYKLLVDGNHHGEVLEEVAKDYGSSYFANLFKSINKINDLEGSLRPDVSALRSRIATEFRECLKQNLEKEEYEIIAKFV